MQNVDRPAIYRRTIAFEVGTQNLAIPLTVGTLSFEEGTLRASQFIGFVCVYALGQGAINFSTALALRYLTPKPEVPEEIARSRAERAGVRAAAAAAAAGGGQEGPGDAPTPQAPDADGGEGGGGGGSKAAVAATAEGAYVAPLEISVT